MGSDYSQLCGLIAFKCLCAAQGSTVFMCGITVFHLCSFFGKQTLQSLDEEGAEGAFG